MPTMNVGIDAVLEQNLQTAKMAAVLRGVPSRITDWLNQDPVPARILWLPMEMSQCHGNDLRTSVACGRPSQLTHPFLVGCLRQHSPRFFYVVCRGDHVRLS